jgi:eukaryotic-like serine/threonine-protein kinase
LDNREARRLVDVRSPAAFASDALLFVRDGILQVQSFDPSTLEFRTDARSFPLAEQVDWFSLSQNGTLVYRNLNAKNASPLVWFDRTGNVLDRAEGFTGSDHFSISPDSRFVAASRSGDIWISDLSRGVTSRLTFDPGEETSPLWSPRGDSVAFISNRDGKKAIYRKMTNGTNPEELLFEHPQLESIESWSPDDRFIIYTAAGQNGKSQNAILPITGDRKPIPLQSAFNTRQGRFSPDGRWLAYVSDESGTDEVYLETFPAGGGRWQVSVDAGANPRWRRDGRELFYISKQRNLMVVPIRATPGSVEFGAALSLFRVPFETYDVADGNRFILPLPADNGPVASIDVVINWLSDIGQ